MKPCTGLAIILTAACLLAGCARSPGDDHARAPEAADHDAGGHMHADGTTHPDGTTHADDGHAHDEVDLGTAQVGDLVVELAQGHGPIEAGAEGHLVVKLPYSDQGATIVRAWIGTEDRTLSYVGRGEYAPSHDDYDVHAMAPDPLPGNARWWIEIEKPDGTRVVGSAKPLVN